ncbi:MAG: CPBP family intramembrane metalloprotease [Oscillospiraceae bacterium]|nr:CPBP family intramembrane metalloprotease [Oscillospiraceae bacterium]
MKDFFNEEAETSCSVQLKTASIDEYNAFDNPTENRDYNESYKEIVPQIELDGCKLPNIPSEEEKKRIRRFYNIAGGGIAFHFLLSQVLSNAFNLIVMLIIMFINNISLSEFTGEMGNRILQYTQTSSIAPAITLLTYLTVNLTVFFFGIKIAGFKFRSLFRTSELTMRKTLQYVFIALFMHYIIGILINIVQMLMSGTDVMGTSTSLTSYYSPKYAILSMMYACIVSPVTEELLYRGFVMKCFSRVSQRFGILISAFFFGLSHGNIAQFMLAFAVGIFMGYIDIKHNSVLPSIIVHIVINMVATGSTLVQNYFMDNITIFTVFNYAVILLAAIGLVMFIVFCKNNIFPKSDIRQQFRCKNIAVTSIGTIIAAIIYLTFTLYITFR